MNLDQSTEATTTNVTEILPSQLNYSGASISSTVQQRSTATFHPVGTSVYGSAGQKNIQFRLTSSNYIDPATCYINARIKTNQAGEYFDDIPALSCIQRATLKVGGVLVESIDNCGVALKNLYYNSVSKNWHETAGSCMLGAWKGVPSMKAPLGFNGTGSDTQYLLESTNYQPAGTRPIGVLMSPNSLPYLENDLKHSNGFEITLPLSFLFGYFRQKSYLPLRNLGEISVELTLEGYEKACFTGETFSDVATLSTNRSDGTITPQNEKYEWSDVTITADSLLIDPVFVSLMDNLVGSAEGLITSFETYSCSTHPMVWQESQNVLISKGASHLRSVYFFMQPAALQNNKFCPKSDFYYGDRIISYQWQIGSDYYPLSRVERMSNAFCELQKALGQNSTQRQNLISYDSYLGKKGAFGMDLQITPDATDNDYVQQMKKLDYVAPSLFTIGVNTERVLGSADQLSGINSKLNGYQISLKMQMETSLGDGPTTNYGCIKSRFVSYPWVQHTDKSILGFSLCHFDKMLFIRENAISCVD